MGINLNPFTWWNGASWGTMLYGPRGMAQMGTDTLGNVYYEGGKDGSGRVRRWVIYEGANDASRVPPEWFSWLHHHIDDVPDRAMPPVRAWQKSAVPGGQGKAPCAGTTEVAGFMNQPGSSRAAGSPGCQG